MLANFLARRRTIESITSPLSKMITKLNLHAAFHAAEVEAHEVAAAIHTDLANFSAKEIAAAKSQAAKFSAMFS